MRLSTHPIERQAVASLVVARIIYAVNWLNIGALFYVMRGDLSSGVSGLGILTSSFYLGVGLMQIPGGIAAAKWGPKRTVTTGILVYSLAALATSISSSLFEVAIFRFTVGCGMALVFAPTVVLATRFLGNRSGIGAGLINSAFDVGGLFGLFGWILIATVIGWRPSLAISGGVGLFTGLLVIALVPGDQKDNRFAISSGRLRAILKTRSLVLFGLAALGSNMGSVLISSFMVFYLQSDLGQSAATAGFVASIVVILPIITSLWGGRIYDRVKKPRRLLVGSGLAMVVALAVCSQPNVFASSVGTLVGGIAIGPASTIVFAAARDLSTVEKEYETLTISWVNCISLTGSVWPPILFSYLVGFSGFSAAWLGGAGLSLLFLIPLLFLRERVRG